MCGKGLSQTSQQTSQPSIFGMMAYNQALGQVGAATAQPFQFYSQDPTKYVASLTPTQTGAISDITGLQGMTQPYYQAAAGLTGMGAAPVGQLTSADINQYMSPYMSQVINPVQAAVQQQQGQQLAQQQSEAIKGGAFGGERAGLQRGQLMGQQNLGLGQALSPLFQTGYGQALQTAQGQQAVQAANLQRMLAAGQQFGQLGTGAQQADLAQAQAQLQAGTLEQQTATAQDQALYNEFQKQRMYPLQTAQLYAQTAGALGPLYGSQTAGYQQLPFFGGLAAKGGAIKGYDDGLGKARMGGAVHEEGDFSRGGYADGGYPDFSSIVEQQRAGIMPSMDQVAFPTGEFRTGEAPKIGQLPERRQGIIGSAVKSYLSDPEAATQKAKSLYQGVGNVKDYLQKQGYLPSPFPSSYNQSNIDTSSETLGRGVYADGGDVTEDAMSQLLSNPIRTSEIQQPQQQQQQQQSGGIMGLIGAGSKLASAAQGIGQLASTLGPLLALKDGGRAGYKDGSTVEGDDDFFERGMIPAESSGQQFTRRGEPLVSPKGATGIAQVLPTTAPEAAKLAGLPLDLQRLRYDTDYNQALGKAYYQDQLRKFGTHELAAAAYNAGPGRVQKAIDRSEREGGDVMSYLPAETQKYVPTVMRKAGLSQDAIGSEISGLGPRERSLVATAERPTVGGIVPVKQEGAEPTDWRQIVLPALAGIGAMAGSRSKYLGSALAEGLGAGAKSYMDVGKQIEEQKKLGEEVGTQRATTGLVAAEALGQLNKLPIVDGPGGMKMIRMADGSYMNFADWAEKGGTVFGTQETMLAAEQVRNALRGVLPGATPSPAGGVEPPTGKPIEEIEEGKTTPISELKDTLTQQKPLLTPSNVAVPVGVIPGQINRSEEIRASASMGSGNPAEDSRNYISKLNQGADSALSQRIYNTQVAKIVSDANAAPEGQKPGAFASARSSAVNFLNTLSRNIGLKDKDGTPVSFGNMETNEQMLDKINRLRAEGMVSSANQPAVASLETMLGALPNLNQTPESMSYNAASNWAQNQRLIDLRDHANYYGSKTGRLFYLHPQAFQQAGNDDVKYAREEEALQKLMLDPHGAKVIDMFQHGRLPDGKPIKDRRQIDLFFSQFFHADVPGISRYFIGAR